MNELIRITEREGRKAVSARELHAFLGCTERFANWFERQLQFGFDENSDYVGCKTFNALANQELQDYAISIDMAKEVSMLQRSEKGKQARKYFLECERVANESKKILTQAEIVLQMAQLNVENERRILSLESENKEIKEQVNLIDARTTIRPDYFSVSGYASLNRIQVGIKKAIVLGKEASAICRRIGADIDKVTDPRFGEVNTYPRLVLIEAFKQCGYDIH